MAHFKKPLDDVLMKVKLASNLAPNLASNLRQPCVCSSLKNKCQNTFINKNIDY